MIVFIKLVKRASILHEKFFIYKDQLTILIKQYLTILQNTFKNTHTILSNIFSLHNKTLHNKLIHTLFTHQTNQTNQLIAPL